MVILDDEFDDMDPISSDNGLVVNNLNHVRSDSQTAERSAGWETHRVRLNRVPGYGFGIAVSGGRDNPHFASGDPSIAVSDVLRGGPAEEKLQVNDRIVSVNGVPLENVEYARAVQVLRDSGATVTLVVRRRAPAPPPTAPTTIKLALSRNGKKEDFGIVIGCKLYIKELTLRAREQVNQAGQGLCEGDMVTKINNTPVTDAMTLKEARKLIESCKERLNLVVTRELIREETVTNGNYQNNSNYNSLGAEPISSAYSSSGQNLYVAAPVRGGVGNPGEGRRGPMSLEHDQPPRPPPPRNDDYYSSRRQLYEEDAMPNQRNKPPSEPRLISFQKEGSVGLRLCGGNRSGVFVSGVQPTSPAALQGLQPADKILKVNDMEMKGVTREEAVLFLLSLQERIDLIVQHSPDEYNAVASGQMPGDSFHIKTHFHYTTPTDGEMSFRCGDVFHVVDTLHNGTVGAWQVYRIGRNNQEVQKGTIPNKARAEELATAQFNATKKELSGGTGDAKHNFFRRRRSTHRRSKSLGKEHWDDVVLSDSISKFPAYERVVLRQPGFIRPVIVLGAVADIARERLLQSADIAPPQMDNTLEDSKNKSTSIIRLSSIRSVMERGKHALLDITPNAVDRLNYAQFYPIVIFLKADNKHIIKQLRAGLPKSAHKSSKKLLEQCQHTERVWGHVFTHTITLSEANANTWFSKLQDLIQRTQQQQIWVSETKRPEPLSDDFLFSMSSSTENRLSYASSPESDLEISPPPAPRLVKSSSDPSIATTQDNMDRDDDINHMNDAVPPPYTQSGYGDSKYGFSATTNGQTNLSHNSQSTHNVGAPGEAPPYQRSPMTHSPPHSPLYGTVPELPPRSTNQAVTRPTGGVLLPAPPPGRPPQHTLRHNTTSRPSAQERLFGASNPKEVGGEDTSTYPPRPTSMHAGSTDHRHGNSTSYDGTYNYHSAGSLSTSGSGSLAASAARLGPNAPDDLKATPPSKFEPPPPQNPAAMSNSPQRNSNSHEHNSLEYTRTPNADPTYRSSDYRSPNPNRQPPTNGVSPHGPMHARGPSLPAVPLNDHAKYSTRTNSASQADYGVRGGPPAAPYKPVPPPKPKHYRPPDGPHHPRNGSTVEPPPPAPPTAAQSPHRSAAPPGNGFAHYPPYYQQQHSQQHHPYSPHNYQQQQNMYGGATGQMPPQSPPYSGPPSHHRAINLPHNPHLIDLAGSREQRGSAFELYRKPQHMHNLSSDACRDEAISPKTKKKLSKKPSFIKNAVLDLFRSKTKQKVSRQKSLCETDLQQRHQTHQPMLRREKSDLGDVHVRNTQIRNQMLQRSNSSCEKPVLRPILKRQSSFCDDRSGAICTVRDYDTKPVQKSLRRQNSMCEIETEPKATPLLRRQNSLIEYNRRGIYGQTSFNMITKIDPIYQRQQQMKHEPFHPTQPLPPEPVYQSKDHLIYDPIPKPRRTYTSSLYDTSSENPYASRSEVTNQSFESTYGQTTPMQIMDPPYATRAECIREPPYATRAECMREPPYATRAECMKENPYATRRECMGESPYATRSELMSESPYAIKQEVSKHSESLYSESPYSSKEQMLRQRMVSESPYASKEEMLRQRFSESPYNTKEEMLKQRIECSYSKEPVYGKRTYDPPHNSSWSENSYGVTSDRRLQTPVHFPGRTSPLSKCMSEPPYASKSEMSARIRQTESPYATRAEVKSSCSDSHYNERPHSSDSRVDGRPASAECTYVSKQEILSQKAALIASRESTYGTRLEEKLEIIKQRNQAKKDMIYQTRKEANESDSMKIREPLYVSKRELKDSVIYESHQEVKETVEVEATQDSGSARSSPYELGDANHLSRREPIYQSKSEAQTLTENETFQEIDFSTLRLTESQTDSEKEKEKSLKLESSVLKGEPIYSPRLHGKSDHISNALKATTSPIPYESTTSMETHYASECSMNFENKPQSTPYASQDLNDQTIKPNRMVTFCEDIAEKSAENSQDDSENNTQNETTIIDNQNTVIQATAENDEASKPEVEPEGPHTTWGIFDSEGGVLEDRQWGVSLIIPPKAIAPGIKQKIYFTVSDPRLSQRVGGPPIDMDNGEAMLSPLVMCGPQGLVFLKPVTLRLPHCANAVPSLGLTIKATDTEAHLSTDWDQIHLPATTTLNTVAVKVDHF